MGIYSAGYKVTLKDIETNYLHVLAVVANGIEDAVLLARIELEDHSNKLEYCDAELFTSGVMMTTGYYE